MCFTGIVALVKNHFLGVGSFLGEQEGVGRGGGRDLFLPLFHGICLLLHTTGHRVESVQVICMYLLLCAYTL